jgi:hypothetical protein
MITRMERPTATMARFLAAPSGDAPIALAQESVGPAGTDGGLAHHAGQLAVAVTGAGVALLAGGGHGLPATTASSPWQSSETISAPWSSLSKAADSCGRDETDEEPPPTSSTHQRMSSATSPTANAGSKRAFASRQSERSRCMARNGVLAVSACGSGCP